MCRLRAARTASVRPAFDHLPALALAASHSAWVIIMNPLPLQEFWPLQALLALLQAECPLQEFTPWHFIFASSACAAVSGALENTTAAAAARATPDRIREFMHYSPTSGPEQGDDCNAARPGHPRCRGATTGTVA